MISMYLAKDKEAAFRIIEGEAVILTPENGMLHTLNSVGTRVFELADGKRRVKDVVGAICDEFEVKDNIAECDLVNFVEDMVHKRILIISKMPCSSG